MGNLPSYRQLNKNNLLLRLLSILLLQNKVGVTLPVLDVLKDMVHSHQRSARPSPLAQSPKQRKLHSCFLGIHLFRWMTNQHLCKHCLLHNFVQPPKASIFRTQRTMFELNRCHFSLDNGRLQRRERGVIQTAGKCLDGRAGNVESD